MSHLQKKQNSQTAWRLLVLTVFGILTFLLFQRPINHDASWYLYAAGTILDGAKIYRDLIDLSPPTIFWLSIAPAWLARILNCSSVPLFISFFLFIVVLSLILSTQIFKKILLHLPRSSQYCFLLVLVFILLPYEMPWNCFGQREHLMLVLVMPYVFASAARLMGYPLQIKLAATLGLLAGIGFTFKPHFLFTYFCIETYLLIAHRSYKFWKRPESLAIFLYQALHCGMRIVPNQGILTCQAVKNLALPCIGKPGDYDLFHSVFIVQLVHYLFFFLQFLQYPPITWTCHTISNPILSHSFCCSSSIFFS